jgi:hypothetical protein
MTILDGEKLREYWDGIARGFQKSPLEAAISVVVIVLLIVVPVALFLLKQKKDKAKRMGRARQVFETFASKKGLSEGERALLQEMAGVLPKGELDLLKLVSKPATFNIGARRLLEKRSSSGKEIAGLRLKLGLVSPGSRRVFHSTAELHRGMEVQLISADNRRVLGRVQAVELDSFKVLLNSEVPLRSNVLEVRISRSTGLYSLRTRVLGYSNRLLSLEHSEEIKRVQKRRFFRKVTRLPVMLTSGDESKESVRARLVDLSAGGAKLRNPGLKVRRGQELFLTIFTSDKDRVKVKSRVNRTSADEAFLVVTFDALPERTREKIMKLIFN